MTEPASCEFCEIVAGTRTAAVIFEDAWTMAFLDITEVSPGHTLVIPRTHVVDLWSCDLEDGVAVMRTAHRVAKRLRDVLGPDGLTLFQANRDAGWQDIFHLHLHLVPRWQDDHLVRPWSARPRPPTELEDVRSRLLLPGS